MLFAIVVIPIQISKELHHWNMPLFCHDLGMCYWVTLGDVVSNVASILNLFCIAVDR